MKRIDLSAGNRGPAVRRLQEYMDNLGFDAGPNDGYFGASTDRLVRDLQHTYGLCQDGIVGPQTWGVILGGVKKFRPLHKITRHGLHDITTIHGPPKNFAWLRPWETIKGVTLHQTGCNMPSDPRGWSRCNAHYGVTQAGEAILINRPEDMIWHAQGASLTTIGIEFEGNFEGVEGDIGTLWTPGGGPYYLNARMIAAAQIIFDDILDRFEFNNAAWHELFAHRQSSKNRRADPGSEIWHKIAKPWIDALNLSAYLLNKTFGRGRPIPRAWDSRGKGAY